MQGRYLAFALLYFSYVVSYLCRKNYSFWFGALTASSSSSLGYPDHLDIATASLFGSALEISYGSGKLLAGPISDLASPSRLLVLSIGASAICNLLIFSPFSVFPLDLALWSMNGLAQSFAWPALAVIFMNYFRDSEYRGTLYSILSTNQNFGSALSPVILTPLVSYMGWRAAIYVPAGVGLSYALILAIVLEDGPTNAEKTPTTTNEEKRIRTSSSQKNHQQPNENIFPKSKPKVEIEYEVEKKRSDAAATPEKKSKSQEAKPSATVVEKSSSTEASLNSTWIVMRSMLLSPWVWSLGIGYAFLTVIRVSLADWTLVLLRDVRGVPVEVARDCLVALEFGGFLGGLAAGLVSDRVFGGRRGPVMVIFTLLTIPSSMAIILLTDIPEAYLRLVLPSLYFIFGFGAFGPHMLVGLAAREIFPKAQSTAGAFTKSVGQFGGALAGYPLSTLVATYGWNAVAVLWGACGILSALAFSPMLFVGAGFLNLDKVPELTPATHKISKAE